MRASLAVVALAAAAAALGVGQRRARADVIAAYASGYGGLSSSAGDGGAGAGASPGMAPALGFQVGARVLIFDAYFDRTAFGDGRAVSRGILGLRLGLGVGGFRLVLRGGAGLLLDEGGALAGAGAGVADRRGPVARAGVALERRLSPQVFWVGIGLDGEVYSLDGPGATATSLGALDARSEGGDLFASLQIKFELGL